jgi:hypothetical protein
MSSGYDVIVIGGVTRSVDRYERIRRDCPLEEATA